MDTQSMTHNQAKPGPTVLVVEHSAAIRRLFSVVLREVADRVLVVENPDEAREMLRRESIDVVVLEPQGAIRINWELLDELVAADIPTVVVTSRAEEEVLQEASRRHAAAVLTKPFRKRELLNVINEI